MISFLTRLIRAIRRQLAVILAVGDYDLNRKSTGGSLGNWEGIIGPMQLMLFFIFMRVGFSYLRIGNLAVLFATPFC